MDVLKQNELVLVDSHVHYYPFCTYSEFFETIYHNMSAWARELTHENHFSGIIFLCETKNSSSFLELRDMAGIESNAGEWVIATVEGEDMLRANNGYGRDILIVPGTQVITAENLEILLIGSSHKIPHGKPARSYIDGTNRSLVIIIPWGVGKWLGKRGKVIEDIITSAKHSVFAVGDNSGRPAVWSHVSQFKQAKNQGISILPGSDPLPVAGQHKKVGGSGIAFYGSSDPGDLLDQLKRKILHSPDSQFIPYGKHDNIWQFLAAQVMLRIKRL